MRAIRSPSIETAPSLAKMPSPKPARRASPERAHHASRKSSGFGAKALEERFRQIADHHEGRYGVVVFDPISEKTAKMNADTVFLAASIGKLPTLISLYKAADRGEVDLDAKISILPSDYRSGSGVLWKRPPGTTMSLEKCAYYLINESDNTAWTMLTRYLSPEYIQSEMDEIGADSTRYWVPNTTTPNDVLLMLRHIGNSSFTSERLSEEMLEFMTNTSLEDRIPAGIPAKAHARVAHKYGSYGSSFGDAGIVFYKEDHTWHRYYIVVLSDGTDEAEARDAIQHFARAAHKAITGAGSNDDKDKKKDKPSREKEKYHASKNPEEKRNEHSGENG